nr:immunoglobulin light chain junction region [Macaca mulatta]MOW62007.1 immunoglobulin light chain junction region [Macaca mulatta]MOW62233.1 immunoglobulin light chain junction region [Macaca mulatta]MOW62370.1 immunoglobulin light chain junction region [Macaca mulatta]MOW62643.1 immunoglobulin light chain junction region [Macaca mulatta]
CLQDLELPLTF